MRRIGLTLLAISLLLGGLAVWSLKSMSGAKAEPGPVRQAAATTVVVAARPIAFGETLSPQALREQPWPDGAAPAGAFHTIAELRRAGPRLALAAIAANEPILPGRLSGPGGRATLSGMIRPGLRASTIRVDDTTGVAGFVLPGDFVDVIVTRSDSASPTEGAAGASRSDILLKAVRVLAVDQMASDEKNDPVVAKAATVEVTPDQAQKLALASQIGALSLALRGAAEPLSDAEGGVRTVRIADLRAGGAQPAPRIRRAPVARASRASGPVLQIYRGAEATSVQVQHE